MSDGSCVSYKYATSVLMQTKWLTAVNETGFMQTSWLMAVDYFQLPNLCPILILDFKG